MRYTGRSNSFHNPLVTFLTFLSNWSRLPGGNNGDIIWSDNPTKTKGPRFQSMSSISSSGTFDHALRRRHVALVGSCRIVVSCSLSNCFSRFKCLDVCYVLEHPAIALALQAHRRPARQGTRRRDERTAITRAVVARDDRVRSLK